jgi:hypothetical protein
VVAGLGGREELLMVRESEAETVVLLESLTVSDAICVPAVVGVPLIVPALPIDRPVGRALADQVYGETPPVAARFAEYAVPTVPAGRLAVEIASGAGGVADDAPFNPMISMA